MLHAFSGLFHAQKYVCGPGFRWGAYPQAGGERAYCPAPPSLLAFVFDFWSFWSINPPAPNCTFWLRSFVSLFCYLLQYSCVILMNDLDVLKLWPEYVLKCDSIKQSKHTTECHCRAWELQLSVVTKPATVKSPAAVLTSVRCEERW